MNFAVEINCLAFASFSVEPGRCRGGGWQICDSGSLGPETADVWAGRRVGSQVRQQTPPRLCTVKSLSLGANLETLGVRLVLR